MKRIAFLFPGQGSQKVGMGKALHDQAPVARAVYEEVDQALGFSVSGLCFEGPEAELVLTANAQPAILATSIAAWRVLEAETGLRPSVVAGHSLGEYSALVCAGALSLSDAARVVRLRGQLMQEAVPAGVGGMAAILGLERAEVEAACAEAMADRPSEVVQPANLNGGGQVVIAGHVGAVARACEAARRRGARRAMPLAVSAPFHSALMQPAADRLREALQGIEVRDPQVPVVSNVEAAPNTDGRRIRDLLAAQVTAPVRWEESMRALAGLEISEAIEVGQGTVMAGLCKRILPTLPVASAADPAGIAAIKQSHETHATEEENDVSSHGHG